jgi:hypothetical protein
MIPIWAIGLALAALAPFIVRILADALEAHAKKRTEELIDRRRQ